MTNILGINCFSHDTAACLLVDGVPVAFVEEERLNRDKHTKAFPDKSIQWCLDTAGITIDQVDVVAFAHKPGTDFQIGGMDAIKRLAAETARGAGVRRSQPGRRNSSRSSGAGATRARSRTSATIVAHAASAFFPSGFDEAAVLTLDRGGDFLSTTMGRGRGQQAHRRPRGAQPRFPGRDLHRRHLVPRLPAELRRGQGHGPCALRHATDSRTTSRI